MSKTVSPLLFRFKNIPNYLNRIHIKLINNKIYLTYIKFFKLLLNFIYLFKYKIETHKKFVNKFFNLKCNYYDFYNIHILLNFSSIKKKQLIFLYKNLIILSNYINYFIKFNLHGINYFIFMHFKRIANYKGSIYSIISSIKYYIRTHKNFKTKIIRFINSIFKKDYYNKKLSIQGIKCVYAGCLYKNSKKKSLNYIKGKISMSPIVSKIEYAKKCLATNRGSIGIKLWLHR